MRTQINIDRLGPDVNLVTIGASGERIAVKLLSDEQLPDLIDHAIRDIYLIPDKQTNEGKQQ